MKPITHQLPRLMATLMLALPVLVSCVIDRSLSVAPGEQRGPTRIIDGNLDVERRGVVSSVRVIDGDVTLREDSSVNGRMHITDGELVMRPGATIGGDLVAHHAGLQLKGARIDGDVELFCTGGTITDSRVSAVVRVRKNALWHVKCDSPKRLIIGPGTKIGTLIVEAPDADVEVSDEATIGETRGPTSLSTTSTINRAGE